MLCRSALQVLLQIPMSIIYIFHIYLFIIPCSFLDYVVWFVGSVLSFLLLLSTPFGNTGVLWPARCLSHELVTLLPCKDTMHNMTHLVKNKFPICEVLKVLSFVKRELLSAISLPSFSFLITLDLLVFLVYKNRTVAVCRLFPAVSRMCCLAPLLMFAASGFCLYCQVWVNLITSEYQTHIHTFPDWNHTMG